VVTGSAGGLGAGLVAEFARQGWRVVASARQPGPLPGKGEVWPAVLDVTNRLQAEELFTEVLARWKRVDALINNAGLIADRPVWEIEQSEFQKMLSVNLKGAFICSQAVLRPMLKQRHGHIVNIASFSGRVGTRGQSNYSAAKAGLFGLTTSLAQEVGSRNIRVNAVLPGFLPTRMTANLEPARKESLIKANALGRMNSIDEVARFIAFLVGTENISGQIFQLDSRIAPWS